MEEEGTVLSHDMAPKAQVVLMLIIGGLAHPLTVFPQVGCSQLTGCPLVAAVWSYLLF